LVKAYRPAVRIRSYIPWQSLCRLWKRNFACRPAAQLMPAPGAVCRSQPNSHHSSPIIHVTEDRSAVTAVRPASTDRPGPRFPCEAAPFRSALKSVFRKGSTHSTGYEPVASNSRMDRHAADCPLSQAWERARVRVE
jgi:hypothetical protein